MVCKWKKKTSVFISTLYTCYINSLCLCVFLVQLFLPCTLCLNALRFSVALKSQSSKSHYFLLADFIKLLKKKKNHFYRNTIYFLHPLVIISKVDQLLHHTLVSFSQPRRIAMSRYSVDIKANSFRRAHNPIIPVSHSVALSFSRRRLAFHSTSSPGRRRKTHASYYGA